MNGYNDIRGSNSYLTNFFPNYQDTDGMWLQDPFQRFYSDADFQIACDVFCGNPDDLCNWPNGGFSYAKSTSRTIQFYKFWYKSRKTYPGKHDQDVLHKIKRHPFITEIGLKMRFLDTAYFGGFCQPSKDLNLVCTMHANCCIGLQKKILDLGTLLEDWRKFMSLTPSYRASTPSFWSVPKECRYVWLYVKVRYNISLRHYLLDVFWGLPHANCCILKLVICVYVLLMFLTKSFEKKTMRVSPFYYYFYFSGHENFWSMFNLDN